MFSPFPVLAGVEPASSTSCRVGCVPLGFSGVVLAPRQARCRRRGENRRRTHRFEPIRVCGSLSALVSAKRQPSRNHTPFSLSRVAGSLRRPIADASQRKSGKVKVLPADKNEPLEVNRAAEDSISCRSLQYATPCIESNLLLSLSRPPLPPPPPLPPSPALSPLPRSPFRRKNLPQTNTRKQGLIEPAIEYATESGAFDHALELAQACCPAKLPGIHLKHALFLEDEERFKEVRFRPESANKQVRIVSRCSEGAGCVGGAGGAARGSFRSDGGHGSML